jgi:two-component system, sensor histidine kinase PdtaS
MGEITHYVGNFTDVTSGYMREEERLRRETEQREALVREVHHRIKNNLQGVIGILRAFGHAHPQMQAPIDQVVGQVQSIAVIHGLQGRASMDQVRACELARAVCEGVASLWHADIRFEAPEDWLPCVLARGEAVPVALVLNELVLNAVKHGTPGAPVRVVLQAAHEPGVPRIRILIENQGQWQARPGARQIGLELVQTLLPADGAWLSRKETGHGVQTCLELGPPVISLDTKDLA